MLIGELSAQSEIPRDTIRYYEKIGLIRSSGYVRQSNNYKSYSTQTLHRLKHIRKLKSAGFTLAEIADMLDNFQQGGHPCKGLKRTFSEKISRIDEKIRSLEKHKRSIQKSMEACNSDCSVNDGLPSCMSC